MTARQRADQRLLDLGLAPDLARARAMILAGEVWLDDERVVKAGAPLDSDARLEVRARRARYASRGGFKLEGALEDLEIDVHGRDCLDVGSSHGGFTECLLAHGASSVTATDVGRGLLAQHLRQDPRVSVHEGLNFRKIEPDRLTGPFSLITVDVSFISLKALLPALGSRLAPSPSDLLLLVKPQFEADRASVGSGGVVSDPNVIASCVEAVTGWAREAGLRRLSHRPSRVLGARGNREQFLQLGWCS